VFVIIPPTNEKWRYTGVSIPAVGEMLPLTILKAIEMNHATLTIPVICRSVWPNSFTVWPNSVRALPLFHVSKQR